jgi:hypothetical protein
MCSDALLIGDEVAYEFESHDAFSGELPNHVWFTHQHVEILEG